MGLRLKNYRKEYLNTEIGEDSKYNSLSQFHCRDYIRFREGFKYIFFEEGIPPHWIDNHSL